jgi:apolipoprotein N-acyltransferase
LLIALSVALLSLALAPVKQFYLAWVGLVPWMLVVRSTRTKRAAFFWSWAGGTAFFLANMWWLAKVTVPGMIVLLLYLGLYWGFAAVVVVGCGLIPRAQTACPGALGVVRSVIALPVIWAALEWCRGNWSMFGEQGLPWLYLGHTQSPLLMMCQVADFGSAYAISFWVVMVNALVFGTIVRRERLASLVPAGSAVVIVLVAVGAYGAYRLNQTHRVISPGPVVLVIQPNYPQDNSGEKGAARDEIVRFHLKTTRDALRELGDRGTRVDLIAWSETMMPPLNASARHALAGTERGPFLETTLDQLARLATESGAALIAGGEYADRWRQRDEYIVASDRRNSAYFFEPGGGMSEDRYDKVHLVPFGEFIPFQSIRPLFNLLIKLGPKYYEDYILTPGNRSAMTVFTTSDGIRFVVPICFEDIVSPLVARMLRGSDATKRADFIVNLTNDGWFLANEMPQHLQAAAFRSIENRVPTARSVNTGVSGFIDSTGRTHDLVPAGKEGWSAARLMIDPRVTFYTRRGDVFPVVCAALTAALIGWTIVSNRLRSSRGAATQTE